MKNKKTLIYIYYAILIMVLASRMNATTEPPLLFRLVYIVAVVLPSLANNRICYPAIITMFYSISLSGFAFSFMPYNLWLYAIITLIVQMYYMRRISVEQKNSKEIIPRIIVVLSIYVFFIDFLLSVGSHSIRLIQNNLYCFILVCLFLLIIKGREIEAIEQLPLVFAVITVVLSSSFLTNRDHYIFQMYGDVERTGWTDPNYFGTLIGIGTICGLIKIFSKNDWRRLDIVEKGIYLAAIALSVPVLLLNASRGAVLAVIVGFLTLFVFSKASMFYKVVVIAFGAVALFYLYTNEYFDLLLLRVQNDDGSGSQRTLIWLSKLTAYSHGNIIQMIFGYGSAEGLIMGWDGKAKGFHNDYVGFIVDYGIVGISLFLYLLYYPIKIIPRYSHNRPAVIVIIVYILTCIMTLEPFIMGVLAFFVFYMYALIIAQTERRQCLNQQLIGR